LSTAGAILAGSLIGISVGKHISARLKTIVMQALGCCHSDRLQMALTGKEIVVVISCLLIALSPAS